MSFVGQHHSIDEMPSQTKVYLFVQIQRTAPPPHRFSVSVSRNAFGWLFSSPGGTSWQNAMSDENNPGHRGLNEHVRKFHNAAYAIGSITERDLIRGHYRHLRRQTFKHQSAKKCLSLARKAAENYLATDVPVADSVWKRGVVNGAAAKFHGTTGRWFENPESLGLRFVGLCSNTREGCAWYLDEYGDETVSGVVYQLPAKEGRERYLAGYADPWNSDKQGRGPAWLSLEIYESSSSGFEYESSEAKSEAYAEADRIAECMSEDEREYDQTRRMGEAAKEASRDHVKCKHVLRAARKSGVAILIERAEDDLTEAKERFSDALDSRPRIFQHATGELRERVEDLRAVWKEGFQNAG